MNKVTLIKLLKQLWCHLSMRRRIQVYVLFILIILSSFAEVFSIGAVIPFLGVITSPAVVFTHQLAKPIVKYFNFNNPNELLMPLTIIFILAVTISGILRYLLMWFQTRLSYAIGADFSVSIYRKTLYQPYSVHVSRNSSEIISTISSKVNTITSNVIISFITIISSFLIIIMILTALLTISPIVAISTFGGFGIVYLLAIFITKKNISKYSKEINEKSTQLIKALQEGLGGIRDVLLDGSQEEYCRIYQKADIPFRRAIANITIIGNSPRYLIESLGMILIAMIAFYLSKQVDGLNYTIPILGSLALGAQRLLPIMQQAYGAWAAINGTKDTLKDTLLLLNQEMPEMKLDQVNEQFDFKNEIILKNVSFKYSINEPLILKDINLTIEKGSKIGIIGTTGCGKSTLLDVIMALLFPTNGELLVDGNSISKFNYQKWQSLISHVPQTIFLSDSTILENIAFGVPLEKIDIDRVREAAQKAQLESLIESWDKKYYTKVGERGTRLSGGQRQRIGIARAFYKKSKIIIFDEATSALDGTTEESVMESINAFDIDLTVIIVAHRVSTLKSCSKIIELSNGQIKKVSTYSELNNNN